MDTARTGGCQCGGVRYRISAEPLALIACHCSECQRQSGSAFGLSLVVEPDHFALTQGQPRCFVRRADSGNEVRCWFCPDCGTRIHHEPSATGKLNVKAGTLDDTSSLEPVMHVWVSSRQPWVPLPDGARCFERNPG